MDHPMDLDDVNEVASVEESLTASPNLGDENLDAGEMIETVDTAEGSALPDDLATDAAAMRARLFPPDDLEIESEGDSTWYIDDWKALGERVHGPAFQVNGYWFRLLVFPEGNRADSVSLYLEASPTEPTTEVAEPAAAETAEAAEATDSIEIADNTPGAVELSDSDTEDNEWAVCAQFGLVMWNPDKPGVYYYSVAQHRFNSDEADWGFTRYYDLRRLFTRHLNTGHAIIEANKVNITAYVRIVKDPTGVLWHNFYNYNSKKETGYVGLKNQGATCYLNSLLQSLYFTKVFRRAVYQIPTEEDKPNSVPAALQRLFYLLSSSDKPVGTLQLTRSFGWDTADAFTQHDVQELNRVLMDNLEGKMKGTAVEGALNNVFVAQMKSYVKCVNVEFESSRTEDYWDIQLNVKGMRDITDSFKDYIQVEMLDGENQYQATGYGLQDARKGVVFQSFPPVLHLQLKRYEYDFNRDMMVKINDRYEFRPEIDLSSYLEEGSDMSEPWIYTLHGVLVHSGDLNAGHYYALLKPNKEDNWYKFDDDRVTRATMKEVLEENFGGEIAPPTNGPRATPNRMNYKRHSSAYMLVYIRKSRVDDILPATEDVVPQHIPQRLEQEAAEENARRKERDEQPFYMPVMLMTNEQFSDFHGVDIGQFDSRQAPQGVTEGATPFMMKILKTMTIGDFLTTLAESLKVSDPEAITLWTMVHRRNKTFRLDTPVEKSELAMTMEELKSKGNGRAPELRLWVEIAPGEPAGTLFKINDSSDDEIVLFLKYFNPVEQRLTGVGTCTVGGHNKASDILVHINKHMGWPEDTPLRLLEEVKPDMIDELQLKQDFATSEITHGDILCFEKIAVPEGLDSDAIPTATQFYEFLQNRILITFRAAGSSAEPGIKIDDDSGSFDLWLNRNDTYDGMASKVARRLNVERLNVEPDYIQFFTTSMKGYQRTPIKYSGHAGATLHQLLVPPYVNQVTTIVVLYEILDISIAELEKKKLVTVSWLTDGLSQEHKHEILVAKTALVEDVIDVLKQKLNLAPELVPRIKMWGGQAGRMHRVYNPAYPVQSLVDTVQVFATIAPQEELDYMNAETPDPDQRLVPVLHFQREVNRNHGWPFTFVIYRGEAFAQTKVRLQKVLGIYDKVFEKIKFAVVKPGYYEQPQYVDDDTELFAAMDQEDSLGLDHAVKSVRGPYNQQAAIFIKN